MKEIGGYIEFEHYYGRHFHENAIKLNCSRSCIVYLAIAYNIKKIYIPYFLCDSIWKICKKHDIAYEFYHIDKDFQPKIPDADFSKDWLYVVNYYGQFSNEKIMELSRIVPHLIVDNVQAFFQKPVSHIITIYGCRKFFGVADGAYLYSDVVLNLNLEKDMSYSRMEFLLGRFEKSASEFYAQYVANNERFEHEPFKRMSALTENIMRSFDYRHIKTVRTDNFIYLHERLGKANRLRLCIANGAFSYPLLIENGVEIRKVLQQKKIYIPTLWPNVVNEMPEDSLEYRLAQNILPLPCDQRYVREDMEYIAGEVQKCIKI